MNRLTRKTPLLAMAFCFMSLLFGCDTNTDDIDLSEDPLAGKIDGEDWEYTVGNGLYDSSTGLLSGMILNLSIQDPCSIRTTTLAYLDVTFPLAVGTYTLMVDDANVIINTPSGGPSYTVPGGYIQILSISATNVVGYMYAEYDDDNYAKGLFYLQLC